MKMNFPNFPLCHEHERQRKWKQHFFLENKMIHKLEKRSKIFWDYVKSKALIIEWSSNSTEKIIQIQSNGWKIIYILWKSCRNVVEKLKQNLFFSNSSWQ